MGARNVGMGSLVGFCGLGRGGALVGLSELRELPFVVGIGVWYQKKIFYLISFKQNFKFSTG